VPFGRVSADAVVTLRIDAPFGQITGIDNVLHAVHDLEHHALDIRRGYASLNLERGDELHTVRRHPMA
jgi:hypothetical protein